LLLSKKKVIFVIDNNKYKINFYWYDFYTLYPRLTKSFVFFKFFIMEVIKLISRSVGGILGIYFRSDMEVMSEEAKRIFSNEEDREKYIKAVEKLKNPDIKEEKITLSNNEEITLVS